MATIIELITGQFLPYIIGAIAIIGGLWGKSKLDKRNGRNEERTRRAAADAKETIQAHEDREDVETDVARGGPARDRLRSDWKR